MAAGRSQLADAALSGLDAARRRTGVASPEHASEAGMSPPRTLPAMVSPVGGLGLPESTRIRRVGTGPVAVIRRKTLTQAGQAGGLTVTAEKRKTVGAEPDGGGLDGIVFDNAAIAKQADKAAAIKAGAVAAGAIGERIDTWGRATMVGGKPKNKPWTPPRMFTKSPGPFGDTNVATLDPFFHRINVPYAVGDKDHNLQLVYQHGSAFQGYVASVTDTSSKSAPKGANMYHGKSNKATTVNPYGDLHAETGSANILAMTEGEGESAIDAYTKLAGEGARWICVRDNAAKLSNDTYFYCAIKGKPEKVLTLRFDELWVAWASHFGKKYNIPNAEVIRQMRASLGREARADEMGPRDVNLEA